MGALRGNSSSATFQTFFFKRDIARLLALVAFSRLEAKSIFMKPK
jgi:hypothetical protein